MILNEYSKTAWINGVSPDINKANLNNLEQGVYDVTAKAMELAAYETNAAASATAASASATAASASAVSAAASAAVYTDLAQDVTDLTTVVDNHAKYSTTEEVVIGTYDGKPLYRKCLSIESLPNASTVNYPHGIANVEKIFIGSNSHVKNGGDFLPLPYPHRLADYQITVFTTVTAVTIATGVNRSAASGKVFLEYTKTTD